jgi:predicted metal-binding protein
MKIAMMNCGETAIHCAAAGCFRAYNERSGGFERYADKEAVLTSYCVCNHCGMSLADDLDMKKKLDRIAEIGTEAVYIGGCAWKDDVRCKTMEEYAQYLEGKGIQIIW